MNGKLKTRPTDRTIACGSALRPNPNKKKTQTQNPSAWTWGRHALVWEEGAELNFSRLIGKEAGNLKGRQVGGM